MGSQIAINKAGECDEDGREGLGMGNVKLGAHVNLHVRSRAGPTASGGRPVLSRGAR